MAATQAVSGPRYTNRALYRRTLREVRPFWPQLGVLLAVDLLATPLLLLTPLPLKVAVDSVLGSDPLPGFLDAVIPDVIARSDTSLLAAMAVLQVVIVLLAQSQQLAAYVLQTRTGEGVTLSFRAKVFRQVQRLSLSFHDQRGTSDPVYRIQYDAEAIQDIAETVIPFVSSTVMLVGAIYVTALIDIRLALVAVAIVPLLFLLFRGYSRRMNRRYLEQKELESSALGVVQEVLSSVRAVKAFGREDREHDRFVRRSGEHLRARVRLSFAEGLFGLLVNVATALGTAAVLFIGIRSVQSGTLSLGELLIVMAYLVQLYDPLETISERVGALQDSLASAARVFQLADETPEVIERPDARPLVRARGDIEFRDVSFSYDGEDSVLQEVSFKVEAGTSVGVVGRTGAGKTTLASLMIRFYDPDSGSILLDGVDLRDYRLADLRNQFALVLQDPVLFPRSIAENICYARPGARDHEVVAAARAANADDFIRRQPDGYDTLIGERGMLLSGGERQRIALARAFLKDAPILILDEPTSAVDTTTEGVIMEAMQLLMTNRTTIMIAHRSSTLVSCDARLEVNDGRVRQLGPQAALLGTGTGLRPPEAG